MNRPAWEVLIGLPQTLDWFSDPIQMDDPHPLQEALEEFVESLDEKERELFYMRYGESMSIRAIAKRLGYNSHLVIQQQLDVLQRKAVEHLERRTQDTIENTA